MPAFYQLSKEEIFHQLNTSLSGLNKEMIPSLQKQFGKNALQEAKQKSKVSILFNQFTDIMIIILIIAALISFLMGEHTDAYVILAIIIGNAWIGYSQENSAEESIRMLQMLSGQYALVLRNNNPYKIETSELVPGDIIILAAGDIVSADARLI